MTLKDSIQKTQSAPLTFTPVFYYPDRAEDQAALQQLLQEHPYIRVYDELAGQLRELVKIQHPTRRLSEAETTAAVEAHLKGTPRNNTAFGCTTLDRQTGSPLGKDEFIDLRTSRNMHKITAEERSVLQEKKIGVIGLSVGQTIALTLAMERICGELRLADFDTVELSNMNRLRTTVDNLGMPKVIVAARELAEMDPYLTVKVYQDGATEGNLDDFLTGGGKLDVLVEECDGIDVKILSRQKARHHRIPVVMDTNDRGMLDIERFDLDPDYPLLHGLIPPIEDLGTLKHLSNEEKIPILGPMAGMAHMSPA